jgi:phage terminase large subunit
MPIDLRKPQLNPALRDFWMTPARNRVLYGGRSSSKSWDAAGFATFLADNFKLRILCVRQFQNKIEESVYALLKTQIERFSLSHRFDIQQRKIYNRGTGTEFMFYGLWRDIMQLKSMEGVDILWIEEGHALTKEQWEILEPTIRKEGSQVWLIFNPNLATDFAYQRFVVNPPPDTIVRLINFNENPFLSSTIKKVIAAAEAEDPDDFAHIYLGVPRDNDDAVVIKRSWIMAAIDAHITLDFKPSGRKRTGFDVADDGDDKNATVSAHGSVVQDADEWKGGEDELLKSCTRVYAHALEYGSHVSYDSIGVGAMAGAKFGELNAARTDGQRITYAKFNAGGAVWRPDSVYAKTQTKNKDHFANIKAQAWWLVADRFRNTYNAVTNGAKFNDDELISIDSRLPFLSKLIDELATPKRDFDANGKVKVESKKDMAKKNREGGPVKSPNLGDAFIMAFAPGIEPMTISSTVLNKSKRR